MKRLFPLIATIAAGALGAAGPAPAAPAAALPAAEIPPIDRAVADKIETATFALG
jgi:hypothetical protein